MSIHLARAGILAKQTVGGGGASDPAAIFGADLHQWLNADALGLADNASVTTFTDQSGNGFSPTQGTSGLRPVFKTAITPGGTPVVRFDGVDDLLRYDFASALSQPFEVWMVCKMRSSTNLGTPRIFYNSFASEISWGAGGGAQDVALGFGSFGVLSGGTLAPTSWHAWGFSANGASSEMLLDGASLDTGDAGSGNLTFTGLGADVTGSKPTDVDIAEIVVIKRVSTSGERSDLSAYFVAQHGTP